MLEIKTSLPISKQEARAYFTDSTLIKTWLCHDAIINPKVGGAYELFWDLENRNHNCTVGCKLTTITEDYISFDWKGPIEYESFMNKSPLTQVVVMFHEAGDHTNVTLLHSGWHSDEKWDEAKVYFNNAWQGAFNILTALVE